MTAEEIRELAKHPAITAVDALFEIAAQLAEANEMARERLAFDRKRADVMERQAAAMLSTVMRSEGGTQ